MRRWGCILSPKPTTAATHSQTLQPEAPRVGEGWAGGGREGFFEEKEGGVLKRQERGARKG